MEFHEVNDNLFEIIQKIRFSKELLERYEKSKKSDDFFDFRIKLRSAKEDIEELLICIEDENDLKNDYSVIPLMRI